MYDFVLADAGKFAVFHTVYAASNIFDRFDWNERVDDARDCLNDKTAYFLCGGERIIGGFTLKRNCLSYPFIASPYENRDEFWGAVLEYAAKVSGESELFLSEIPEADAEILVKSHGAALRWSKRRMIRPTEKCDFILAGGYCFDGISKSDKPEIVNVIYEAHAAGHTSTVWKADLAEIETAVERRFDLFGQTKTLHMGNVVRSKENREIVGVCIAGIYPCSEEYSSSNFATIHQVSVKPEHRRKGIAKAMLLKSINDASALSPAITLGVLVGNPAEKLYNEIGFRPGPGYSELIRKI